MSERDAGGDAPYETANQHLVPWALRMLEGRAELPSGRHFARTWRTSERSVELTAEARDRLAGALPLAVVRFLSYAGGWRAVSVPKRRGGDVVLEDVRLSDDFVWRDWRLEFRDHSLRSLLDAFEFGFHRRRVDKPARVATGAWASGDVLVAHMVRWYIRRADFVPGAGLVHDALSAVCADVGLRVSERDAEVVFDKLLPVLPWLSFQVARSWLLVIDHLWHDREHFHGDCQVLACAVIRWREEALRRRRPDLLRPLIETTQQLFGAPEAGDRIVERVRLLFSYLPHADRQERYDAFAAPLRALLEAKAAYQQCRAAPPFDRDAAQTIFMRDCESAEASALWQRLDQAIGELEGRIR